MNQSSPGLTGNQLKIIALIAMTIDHIGVQLLPQISLLRIIGRLAFPIFAYMIAEGCLHTRHRGHYLQTMASLAALCQAVYFLAMGSLYMSVLVSFSLSILLIYAIDFGRRGGIRWAVPVLTLALIFFLCEILPRLLPGTDYAIDYGFWGVMLPVFVYLGTSSKDKFALMAAGLILLNRSLGGFQWWSLTSLIPLYFYNGTRGKKGLKYLFYIYYPAHLVVIQGIQFLLRR